MNNEQFRRLAFGSGALSSTKKDASSSSNGATPSAAPAILGSRQRSSIPMTPRAGGSVSQLAFAKQMAERFGQGTDKQKQPQKKSKLSATKGSRFAAGYVDRAKLRAEHENDDDSRTVPKGLDFDLLNRARNGEDVLADKEEKKEEEAKDEPQEEAGPDVDDEFAQLEKVEVQAVEREKAKKKGQYSTTAAVAGQKRSRDQILAELKAARAAAKAKATKAAAEPVLGSRFKKIGANSTGHRPGSSRIERDSRGREVLVIVDEDGHEKRKVRKIAPGAGVAHDVLSTETTETAGASKTKPDGEVLGMEVPEFYRKKLEAEAAAEAEKKVNIFDDAGSDYDPLAGMGSDSESDSGSDKEPEKRTDESNNTDKKSYKERRADTRRQRSRSGSPRQYRGREDGEASDSDDSRHSRHSRGSRGSEDSRNARRRSHSTQPTPAAPPSASTSTSTSTSQPTAVEAAPRRSYFGSSKLLSEETRGGTSLDDPSVLAALRKAKQLREATEAEEKNKAMSKEAEREARLKKLLQNSERDAEDLDLEFSVSRGGVEVEDEGDDRVRFSKWKGKAKGGDDEDDDDDDDDEGGGGGKGQGKRKRGGKKRKGDGNNVADVMRVLESRKGGSK